MNIAFAHAAIMVFLAVAPATGQRASTALPVSGTMVYNRVFHGSSLGASQRFAGRVMVRVEAATYLGFALGSWLTVERVAGCAPDCEFLVQQSEAIVYQVFGQRYVVTNRTFFRAAIGVGETRTLLSTSGVPALEERRRWRPAATLGVGVDVGVADPLFVTTTVDYTHLVGVASSRAELRRGLAVGVGLTVR